MLKITSWNVNGIRACEKKGFSEWVKKKKDIDIFCLQEVRAQKEQIPGHIFELRPFSYWFEAEKKGYSGVGIMSAFEADKVLYGMNAPEFDCEGRVLTAIFEKVIVVTAYFPNSQDKGARVGYKVDFCRKIHEWLEALRHDYKKPVVVNGDFNIAHEEIDLARPDTNHESAGFLPQEREWMTEFLSSGWVDSFRELFPKKVQYSWWSARTRARERNVGWRIDYHSLHRDDLELLSYAKIDDKVLGSDHCPVHIHLNL